jgi:ribosomal protein S18 acetylase RimI-like enzyme
VSAPGAPIVVRHAAVGELADAGAVVAEAYLHDLVVSAGYVAQLRDAAGRAEHSLVLVAVLDEVSGRDPLVGRGGEVLGSITYVRGGTPMAQRAAEGECELRMLGVSPAARGLGVAAALIAACLDMAAHEGVHRVVLSTQPQMAAARRLYVRFGFSRRPEMDWRPEPGVELLGYDLVLPDPPVRRPGPDGAARP